MKKPYIEKYSKVGKFTVWIVDGPYIRENIDEEFTSYGQHYRFKFIPENELWIDKRHGKKGEEKYYIHSMLMMDKLLKSGVSHKEAVRKTNISERNERKKGLIKNVKIKELKEYSGKVKVWLVSGELVRDFFWIDFTEGGHDKVYNFIPDKEVWIDNDLSKEERIYILIHELHERKLMAKGKPYAHSHYPSSKLEYYCRHHPEKAMAVLKNEIKMNK